MYTIAVVTGTRAEYGLLRPVLYKIQQSSMKAELLVTGAHLSPEYGYTVQEIENDGFNIAAKLDIFTDEHGNSCEQTAERTQRALQLFLQQLQKKRPDAVMLLGDRYEAFAAGQAAALLNIPLVHISGGDVTNGADDDWFRHCLTKMAKLHFPSCEAYRRRLLRMGELPSCVFNVGALGDENIRTMKLLSKSELAPQLPIDIEKPYVLITLHPETQSAMPPKQQAQQLLQALEKMPQYSYLFTGANADAGGSEINNAISEFCKGRANAEMVMSLGVLRYLSAMKYAAMVVGNSSSGVVETPALCVPTVDIGMRQQGRVTGENVIHCAMQSEDIYKAMQKAQGDGFAQKAKSAKSPYQGGATAASIVEITERALEQGALNGPKIFYDGEAAT